MVSAVSVTASPTSSTLLERPRLMDALATPAPFVALVGPIGSGASTLLRQWAIHQTNVTWASADAIPDAAGAVLIIDDADGVDTEGWERIRSLRRTRPQLLVRVAVRSRSAVPAEEEAEFVHGLSFTVDETSEYLSNLSSQLDSRTVHLATGGSPAAVRAVAQLKTTRAEIVAGALAGLGPGALDRQHVGLAIPEVLTHELVRELGGPTDFIDEAERAGMGQWTVDAGHPLFVLTAPVRAATAKAHPTDDPEAVRNRAAEVLIAQGAWYGALVEGAAAGSLAVVDAALRGGGMPLLRMHGATIAAVLRGIHLWELRRWPVIAMAQALIYNARREHRVRAIELMGIALIGARSAPAGSAERGLLRLIESVLQRLLGVGDGGVKAAQAASRILRELPADEYHAIHGLLGDLHTHAAISLMAGGVRDDALAEFERGLATADRPGLDLLSYGGLAAINALAGDLVTAQNWVDTALKRPWPDAVLNEYAGCLLRIAQAKIAVERNDLDGAEEAIDSVWHIIDTVEYWPLLAHMRALIDICRGRAGGGLERFRALRRSRGSRLSRWYTRLLDLTESSLALAAGDHEAARAFAPRGGDAALVTIGVAHVAVFDGQYERALRMLGSIAAESPEERTSLAVLEAVVLRRLGRSGDAAVAARRACTVADAYGLKTPFLLLTAEDRELFDVAVPWGPPAGGAPGMAPKLTERERVILHELVESTNVNDIAERLHVSANTVKSQRRTLYRKLGATSRDEALAAAIAHGLLAPTATG
ncbi:LuxR C-terminal-related transcriptional regulator [Microbacterium abyssi]|uniref:LuxR C-terminal-related transcriptional regulator n=1 Tax=Microbacterium abyssi TaxID=2782166 RepID=UPI001886DE0B|nr:LuxR C-terminal-related transcriptional regulator [Microbacterium sp. A18JL241]